jgi:hypothetical protein
LIPSISGVTPKVVRVSPGQHVLQFNKDGFTPVFPLALSPDDASGVVVSYELGAAAYDTVELRDGSVLVGDLESMSATEVVLRLGGKVQRLNRHSVKRILLTERDMPATK